MGKRRLFDKNIKVWLALLVSAFLMTSCGQNNEKPSPQQQSAEEQQEYEKAPDKLKAIEANVEKIFEALDGPFVTVEDEKEKKDGQEDQQQESTKQQEASQGSQQEKSGQQSQGGQQSKGGQQGEEKQKAPQAEAKSPWNEIEPIINNLHYQWNDYRPDAAKKGADPKITENFSNALNTLTETIKTKDKVNTLKAANNLYRGVFDLYSLYRTKMSPEIKRIRYLIRNTILDSMTGNWDQAGKDATAINSSWSMLRNTLGKDQQTDIGKLDFSILELDKVIAEKNSTLTDIKGRVALSNIQSIEKSYEKE